MKQYLELMQDIIENGHTHEDRTGVGRRSVFSRDLRFDLSESFPLVTTRKVFTRGMIIETLWFLSGSNRTLDLEEQNVNIWKQWTPTKEDANKIIDKLVKIAYLPPEEMENIYSRVGTIGPMYGAVWRGSYGKLAPDQISELLINLLQRPYHSRHCVTAWLPEYIPLNNYSPKENVLLGNSALAACHCFFQCFCTPPKETGGKIRLSLKLTIRSSDGPVGLPYNISQYALILMILAQCVDMEAHELIVSIGDAHIYTDQIDLMKEQIKLVPKPLSKMIINPQKKDIDSFVFEDFKLEEYEHHPVINYPIAV